MRKSCRSIGERKIEEYLKKNNIKYIKEKTFSTCLSLKNHLLRFDFYIIDTNILIEFQGQHHFFPVNKGRRAKYVHQKTLIHDRIKRDFAAKNNLKLIEIHFKDKERIDKILDDIFKKKE